MTYARIRDLELEIEELAYDRLVQATRRFERVTTVVVLRGGREEGRGEDVNYDAASHDALPQPALRGRETLQGLSRVLDGLDLDAGAGAGPMYSRDYRRWAFESAALDLALRQAGTSLGDAVGTEYRPVRFCVSTGYEIERWLAVEPELEFKLDATRAWTRERMAAMNATGRVRCVDMKAYYTWVDELPASDLYRDVVECFPDAVIEDALVSDETADILEPARDRLSWDSPIHSLADVDALPVEPRFLNIKPSRFGTLERLLECVDACRERGISMYGGGQFELGVGRDQIQELASLFYPDGANDVAPSAYNEGEPRAGLPRSPLPPPERPRGFAFGDRSRM